MSVYRIYHWDVETFIAADRESRAKAALSRHLHDIWSGSAGYSRGEVYQSIRARQAKEFRSAEHFMCRERPYSRRQIAVLQREPQLFTGRETR